MEPQHTPIQEGIMTDNPQFTDGDEDVQGHRYAPYADAETSEGGDVEGHRFTDWADAETSEGSDVEGHRFSDWADA